MKTLLVLRHGKSDWKSSFDTDHDRPLAKRGLLAARRMGHFLAGVKGTPERVLSSTAVRARTTAELAHQAGDWRCPIDLFDSLYGATVETVVNLLRSQVDVYSRLLIVGHQPTLSETIAALTGGQQVRFPTAALAEILLEIDAWSRLTPGDGRLSWLVHPRLLDELDR